MSLTAVLVLEDGNIFQGTAAGIEGFAVGEVVFNTSITGYQEILTDPSYARQIVTLTYPHIGNVGVNFEDEESSRVHVAGLVIKDLSRVHSNWRSRQSLSEYLQENRVVAIAEIDTRRLTRILREKGALNGCIVVAEKPDIAFTLEQARIFPGLQGMDLAKEVSCSAKYHWSEGTIRLESTDSSNRPHKKFKVAVYDFGIKRNILRILVDQGCDLTIYPATTPADVVIASEPDGIFLSNGPGDPEACTYAIQAIQTILETNIPVFGICLGHQLLALASGARTVKMKFGHHGANHPVQDLETGKVVITSQNHGFAVDLNSLPPTLKATHLSLFDKSLQGIRRVDKPAFSFQGHPEASPGPHDAADLFDRFIHSMQSKKSMHR